MRLFSLILFSIIVVSCSSPQQAELQRLQQKKQMEELQRERAKQQEKSATETFQKQEESGFVPSEGEQK